ncbi:hypothetical protein DW918_00550 [Eubacterium ventriosum]|uniref:Uncharacterized protein n=2 Tax=Clostridia TaxID=186801 RepID=B0G6E9_9FIRM|nr:hypothetical protein DORFOR_01933 [Dorea formicigenerans ATCC 27755]RHA82070.1 hypothetical protein DW918_00550 [Eubacterium ventriosum]
MAPVSGETKALHLKEGGCRGFPFHPDGIKSQSSHSFPVRYKCGTRRRYRSASSLHRGSENDGCAWHLSCSGGVSYSSPTKEAGSSMWELPAGVFVMSY